MPKCIVGSGTWCLDPRRAQESEMPRWITAIVPATVSFGPCAVSVPAHDAAEWIQRTPSWIDAAGQHRCGNECPRWDAEAFGPPLGPATCTFVPLFSQ